MLTTKSRIQKMMYYLSKSSDYTSSRELAHFIGVSERTVKNEIDELNKFANKMGAKIISKHGYGYKIEVLEAEKYLAEKEQLDIRMLASSGYAEESTMRVNEIIRVLLAEDEFVKLDDIADSLHLARGSLRTELRNVRAFFELFDLDLITKPKYGAKVCGSEFSKRLCMLEMYEFHYHKVISTIKNSKYIQYFHAEDQEINKIRQIFLNTLRGSDIKIVDFLNQRISRYLILLRNSYRYGRRLNFNVDDLSAIKCFKEYDVAQLIINNLQKEHAGYEVDDDEIAALALLLMIWADLSCQDDFENDYPILHEQSLELIDKIKNEIAGKWQLDISNIPDYQPIIESSIIPIIIKLSFSHLIKFEIIGAYVMDSLVKLSPLSIALAETAADVICEELKGTLSTLDKCFLAVKFYALIDKITFDYRKRKVIICSRYGYQASEITKDKILRHFGPEYFQSIDIYNLYEVRGLNFEDYHHLILSYQTYTYRYSIPCVQIEQIMKKQHYDKIWSDIIAQGFDLQSIYSSFDFDNLCLFDNFEYISKAAFIKLISYKCAKDYESIPEIERALNAMHRINIINSVLTIIINSDLTKKNYFELYNLSKPGYWDDSQIVAIVFVSVSFENDFKKARFIEHATGKLVSDTKIIEEIVKSDDLKNIVDIVRNDIY